METSQKIRFCDFLRAKLPAWKDLTNEEIVFHLFTSLTNKVYKVTAKRDNISPNSVILRNFCSQEGIIDKDKEAKVFAEMSKTGFGPKCYGQEGDIRLEEFIASRTIQPHEYRQKTMRRKLAKTMATIHKLEVPGLKRKALFETNMEDPSFYKQFDEKCDQEDLYTAQEKETIRELRMVSSQEEREYVKNILPLDDVCFSHNDLLQGNVLITEGREDVMFIDYEYAEYNFRGFDIGNMYKEATFDYYYPQAPYFQIIRSNFPDDEELRDFVRYYLAFTDMDAADQNEKADELIANDEAMKEYLLKNYEEKEFKQRENLLYRNAKIGVMLSNYHWSIWAVKMHKTSDSPFNYLEYGREMAENYKNLKIEIASL
jgi:thiamine kinase-like enzyme